MENEPNASTENTAVSPVQVPVKEVVVAVENPPVVPTLQPHLAEVFNRLLLDTNYLNYVQDNDVNTDKEMGVLDKYAPSRLKLWQFIEKENVLNLAQEELAQKFAEYVLSVIRLDNREIRYKVFDYTIQPDEFANVQHLAQERLKYPLYIKAIGDFMLKFPKNPNIFAVLKVILEKTKEEDEKTVVFQFFDKALSQYPTSAALLKLYVDFRKKYASFTDSQRVLVLKIGEDLVKNTKNLTDKEGLRRIVGMADFKTEKSKSILAVIVTALDRLVELGETNLAPDAYQARFNMEN